MPRELTKKQKQIIDLAKTGGTDKDLVILKSVHAIEDKFDAKVKEMQEMVEKLTDPLRNVDMIKIKGEKGDMPSQEVLQKAILPLIPKVRDGRDGKDAREVNEQEILDKILDYVKAILPKDGKTPSKQELLALMKPLIPKVKDGKDGQSVDEKIVIDAMFKKLEFYLPEKLRDSLESLYGDNRIDMKAIRGLDSFEELAKELKRIPKDKIIGGIRGFQLYIEGVKRSHARMLNFIAGDGVTITYASSSGRNDITISAGESAGLDLLEVIAGTIDDSNTAFTLNGTPTIVIVNGASYRHGTGVSISGASITLDNPVGSGGDLYGIGTT